MFGIFGFAYFNKKTGRGTLNKMSHLLAHRGTGSEGYGLYDVPASTINMGHGLLNIINLSEGKSKPKAFQHQY